MRTLRNTTLGFDGGVDTQAFITALRITLNRYHFGKVIRLEFRLWHLENRLTITASISYPGCYLSMQESVVIEQIRDHSEELVNYVAKEIIWKLAFSQEEKPKAS